MHHTTIEKELLAIAFALEKFRSYLLGTRVFVLFTGVEGRSPEYKEPQDLRSNPLQGGGNDAILPCKGIG